MKTRAKKGRPAKRSLSPAAATTKRKAGRTAQPKAAESKTKAKKEAAAAPKAAAGDDHTVSINRAPVLKLWASVVAQRQGHSWEASLTFGDYIAGMMAQSKGRSLGLYEKHELSEEEREERRQRDEEMGVERVEVFGVKCPAVAVGNERHAVSGGTPINPGSVQGSLRRAFGGRYDDVKVAMEELATAIPSNRIGKAAYKLYERFRPEWRGWGVKGDLSLSLIRELALSWQDEA